MKKIDFINECIKHAKKTKQNLKNKNGLRISKKKYLHHRVRSGEEYELHWKKCYL